MSPTNFARIAKVVAIVGFSLPWVAVSCANQRIASASGFSLAIGDVNVINPLNGAAHHIHGQPNWWLAAAVVAIVGGLALGLALRGRGAAGAMLAAALLGAALSAAGLWSLYAGRDHDMMRVEAEAVGAGQSGGLARIDTLYGFWLTLAGLAATAGLSTMALTQATRAPEP